jgi:glyoxylase-like metal-dependent hydrolase (beta-lactamase superfamily II)
MVLESKRNLTAIYSTHGHPDHYFGLAVMKPAFPNARRMRKLYPGMGMENLMTNGAAAAMKNRK